jgi:hypothetical protein
MSIRIFWNFQTAAANDCNIVYGLILAAIKIKNDYL